MGAHVDVVSDAIRGALAPGIAFAGGRIEDALEPLFASEQSAVRRAVAKRRDEFTAGRTYARRALAALGVAVDAIPVGERRAPVWPRGAVGSISHCERYCAAVAARRDEFAGIGLDVELDDALDAELISSVCSPGELNARVRGSADVPKLIFCIKESVYKAYFPLARTYLEFHDVALDVGDGIFAARLTRDALPPAAGRRRFAGGFAHAGGVVAAWTAIAERAVTEPRFASGA